MAKKVESELVATGKQKQDVIVCDRSGSVKVTLWEENIDILEEQYSSKLCRPQVQLQQVSRDGAARIKKYSHW